MKKIYALILVFAICFASVTAIAENKNGRNYSQNKRTTVDCNHKASTKPKSTNVEQSDCDNNKKIIRTIYEKIEETADNIRTKGLIQLLYEEKTHKNGYDALRYDNIQSALDMYVNAYNQTDSVETRLNIKNTLSDRYDNKIQSILADINEKYGEDAYNKAKSILEDDIFRTKTISAWTDAYIAANHKKLIEYKIAIEFIQVQEQNNLSYIDNSIEEILIDTITKEIEKTQTETFYEQLENFLNDYIDKYGNNDITNNLLSQVEIINHGHIIGE